MAKECCICEKKIGFMEGTPHKGGDLCLTCNAKYSYLIDSNSLNEVQDAIEYFNPLMQREGLPQDIKEELSELILMAKERVKPETEKNENTHALSLEQKKRILFIKQNHLITTGFGFQGYQIVAYHGLVSGEVVLGTGFLSEITASFADLFGTQSNSFAQKMKDAKLAAQEQLIQNTVFAGGNAVIGVDFDYIIFGGNMLGVSVNGTAVKVVQEET